MFGALHRSVTLPYLPLIILLPLSPCDYRSRAALLFSVCVSRPRPRCTVPTACYIFLCSVLLMRYM